MTNQEVAKLLRYVAAAYTLKGENRFRVIAYERAAEAIEKSVSEVKDLWKEGRVATIPGIGKHIGAHLDELFRTGSVKHFRSVLGEFSKALFPLLDVPGFGAKKAFRLTKELKLNNPKTILKDLLAAAKRDKIARLSGFGSKSQEDIIEALKRFTRGQVKENRMPLPYALATADTVIEYLKKHKDTRQAVPLGSLRRSVATIGDIDIAVATEHPEAVLSWFLAYPNKSKLIEKGPQGATILLTNGRQVDLRVQQPGKFGAMLQYFTGSKNHNIRLREFALKKGLSLSEYGIKPVKKVQSSKFKAQSYNSKLKMHEFAKEEDFYQFLGLSWIPPELREDQGEIEAAFHNTLPQLVKTEEIGGDLHIHSNYNLEPSHDLGTSSLEDILQEASQRGYAYIGISDHNPSISHHTKTEIVSILRKRKSCFEQIISSTKSVRVHLFIMLEVDIFPDGKLAIPDEAFDYLDAAIVSIHSSFGMDKEKMTKRILSGLSHPKAKILAHPTGRLLGSREGYEADWQTVFAFCRSHGKAIEINAHPQRLDLPDSLVKQAIEAGVKLIIDTDSHDASQLLLMRYGVSVARRGWASANDILNTLPYNKFKDWLTK